MKRKNNVIKTIIIAASFLCGGIALQAQGIYSTNDSKTNSTTNSNSKGGGIFRDDGDDFGGDGEDRPPAPGDPDTRDPIGEGILILSLLSGGYALVKRNVRKKNEY